MRAVIDWKVFSIFSQIDKLNVFYYYYFFLPHFPCLARQYHLQNVANRVDECWILLVKSALEDALQRHKFRTSIIPSHKSDFSQISLVSELDFLLEDDLPTKISASDSRINCPLKEPNKMYDQVKACFLALEPHSLDDDSKYRLIEILAYFDELRLKPNKWMRLSKWHRKRFIMAQKGKPLEAKQSENLTTTLQKLSSVCLDMVSCKTKLFENSGGQMNEKLIHKMAYYGTTGVKANKKIMDSPNIDEDVRVEALRMMGHFYTKLFSPDREEQMSFAKKAIETFSSLIDFCKSDEALRHKHQETFLNCLDTKDMLERQVKLHEQAQP